MMIAQVLCLLLLVLDTAKADDGCEWKCGDICIAWDCHCGNTTIASSDNTWCCGTGCSDDNCSTGEVLPLTQTCHGQCNRHPRDRNRNLVGVRSHIPIQCDNMTRCLPEQVCNKWDERNSVYVCVSHAPSLCTGAPPVCTDRQDMKDCWEERNKKTCNMKHGWEGDPSYPCKNGRCVSINTGTGVYDCPLRDDEATSTNIPDKERDSDESDQYQDQVPHMEPCVTHTRSNICENKFFARLGREFYKNEKLDRTSCEGAWPGQYVKTGFLGFLDILELL